MTLRAFLLALCSCLLWAGSVSAATPSLRLSTDEEKDVINPTLPTSLKEPSKPSTQSVRGVASYYCCTRNYPAGLYAAAGPALRVGEWRGRQVHIEGIEDPVTLIDWCQCYAGTPEERAIDLYPEVFAQLDPLSAGITWVQVSW